ncbi:2-keto-4-pentenoate hydratase [Pseudoalteromonas sp. S1727]|uniref:2-keto-4-pentenoate hydratase n=1 Tax=Pseudoalteromonas sp. S1727 TaxID=2066514 RepID=UPI0011083DF2|nr:2-keto-4-pentenoate hydratase [Pseudoalteromonas sp. S1727]TMN74112.1 2-keto-4-pentenoate hydratase [Pseudoalteromonas sp. S1727]
MEKSNQLKEIAAHLFAQRGARPPISDLPNSLKLASQEESLLVQQQMIALNHQQVFGWKCLLPLKGGEIILAPILRQPQGLQRPCQLKVENNTALVEPEIAFVLGQDLPENVEYNRIEIDNAVSATYMALELIQERFSCHYQASHFEKLADGLSNQGLLIGPEIAKEKAYQASEIAIAVTQGTQQITKPGKHPCRYPQEPLYWAVNYLSALGVRLKAGQVFITGSYCGVLNVATDIDTHIEYAGLGDYTIKFASL